MDLAQFFFGNFWHFTALCLFVWVSLTIIFWR